LFIVCFQNSIPFRQAGISKV